MDFGDVVSGWNPIDVYIWNDVVYILYDDLTYQYTQVKSFTTDNNDVDWCTSYDNHFTSIAYRSMTYLLKTLEDRFYSCFQLCSSCGFAGGSGTADGLFNSPRGVYVGPTDHMFVADTGNNRIQVFEDISFDGKFGTAGTGDGQFNAPSDVTVDANGYVYVADTGNNRIQKFMPY
jgi:DNA-binding beta-propeller fold protein YncE